MNSIKYYNDIDDIINSLSKQMDKILDSVTDDLMMIKQNGYIDEYNSCDKIINDIDLFHQDIKLSLNRLLVIRNKILLNSIIY